MLQETQGILSAIFFPERSRRFWPDAYLFAQLILLELYEITAMTRTHYDTLGVSTSATLEQIKAKYRLHGIIYIYVYVPCPFTHSLKRVLNRFTTTCV